MQHGNSLFSAPVTGPVGWGGNWPLGDHTQLPIHSGQRLYILNSCCLCLAFNSAALTQLPETSLQGTTAMLAFQSYLIDLLAQKERFFLGIVKLSESVRFQTEMEKLFVLIILRQNHLVVGQRLQYEIQCSLGEDSKPPIIWPQPSFPALIFILQC